ncbi:MAG TPA: SDR family NAD(P)-dependent oxidoreductase [Anaeromyxobacteraceae bacterium]|nr:SDR family NAD(P)-dependent oxidoreductase [Anaeromyxobacteraceae bacterium]
MPQPVCLVVGVGPGNGAAIARRFAADGYAVGLVARSEAFSRSLAQELGPAARFHAADAGNPAALEAALAALQRDLGDADVLVHNAGSGDWGNAEEATVEAFERAWRVNALGALCASQQVLPAMRRRGQGTIVFIGATASRRGGPRSAAFSSAKGAQRNLAESMARHLWPAGIHVALVVIDGVVDLPRTRQRMPDKPDSFFVKPVDVASAVASIARQPRSAWSFEVEARPFGEAW